MAEVMRRASLVLASCLGLFACSTASPGPDSQSPSPRMVTYHHYVQSAGLQYDITNRPTHTLLDQDGEELVLKLAHAQNCLASLTATPDLAHKTEAMLDAYVEFRERNESEPSAAFGRRARRARIDAEATQQGTTTPYFLGCTITRPSQRGGRPMRSASRGRRPNWNTYGYGPPWKQGSRSVPGGVIR